MRALKRVFKGDQPSTGPWCTYVNEPVEPEELSPGLAAASVLTLQLARHPVSEYSLTS